MVGYLHKSNVTGSPEVQKIESTPARGVLEVKAPCEEVDDICVTEQINKYWDLFITWLL